MPASGPDLVVDTDRMGAPAQTVTSNDVTLEVDEGISINLGFDDAILGEEGKKFKALEVPTAHHARYVDPSLDVELLYAFYPFEARFRLASDTTQLAPVRLSFPNTAGWAPDAEVEFLALGSYLFPEWVAAATFEVVAEGRVSGDGLRITLNEGDGFPYLTWVGLREKL
jgi:hypothetical protein